MVLATAPDGAFYMRHSELLSGDYTIVFEVRVKEDTSKTPVIGFEWAFTGAYDNYVALMFSDKFLMEHNHGGPKDKEKLARVDFYQVKGGVDRTVFNRFEIRVKGVRAAFYVNGHEVFHYDAPENVFKGVPAILVQDCTAEIRKISVIRPDSGKK
jgi:hypothetical protein